MTLQPVKNYPVRKIIMGVAARQKRDSQRMPIAVADIIAIVISVGDRLSLVACRLSLCKN